MDCSMKMQEWATSVKCRAPALVLCCAWLGTRKPSVWSSRLHLRSLWLISFPFWGGAHLLTPSAPRLPPLRPHPFSALLPKCLSIRDATPTHTFRTLILKVSSRDFPSSSNDCHTFCPPKLINVWTLVPWLSSHLCLTSCSLSCLWKRPRVWNQIIYY